MVALVFSHLDTYDMKNGLLYLKIRVAFVASIFFKSSAQLWYRSS